MMPSPVELVEACRRMIDAETATQVDDARKRFVRKLISSAGDDAFTLFRQLTDTTLVILNTGEFPRAPGLDWYRLACCRR